ncbi:M48 family metalloprotease [Micromonospora sediminimaris]|uniref:M48 family metalloprotease n=1 Tax=Micromonospora sediminimaris TaxID=547162 RepID=UPI0037A2C41E
MTAVGQPTAQHLGKPVLASGTTLRFVVLAVLILVSSATMIMLVLGAGPTPPSTTGGSAGCELAAGGDPSRIGEPFPQQNSSAYRACVDRFSSTSRLPWWPSRVWPALVVVVAAALMWTIPAWKARRSRVVPLETVDVDGDIRKTMSELAAVAGLDRLPRIVIDPAAASGGAVVFGSNRRPTVCLHGGLLVGRSTDPEGFRAVVLHEYAHIRNGDVTLTYLTVALWRAFLGAVLLPYVLVLLTLAGWAALFATGVRAPLEPEVMEIVDGSSILLGRLLATAAVLVVLVHLARADVLRSRETYADLAAVSWGADPRKWSTLALATGGGADGRGRLRRLPRTVLELWSTHPRGDLRQVALVDPAPLYVARALPMFLTGVLAPLINSQLGLYAASYDTTWLADASRVLTAVLVAGVAGTILWRASAHAVLTGQRVSSGLRAGLWLGIGMAAGELTGYQVGLDSLLPAHPAALLLPICTGALFGWWTARCAELWIRAWPGSTFRPMTLLGTGIGGVLLSSWFAWWQVYGGLFVRGWPYSVDKVRAGITRGLPAADVAQQDGIVTGLSTVWPSLVALTQWPLTLTSVALLWLVPLAAWAVRSASGTSRNEPGAQQAMVWPPVATTSSRAEEGEPQLRDRGVLPPLRRVLLPGFLGGVLAACIVAGAMAYMHTWPPPTTASRALLIWTYLVWVLIALVVGAGAAATTAAALVDRYRLLCALIGAQTSVLVGFAGAIAVASLDGCVPQLSVLRLSCHPYPIASAWLGFRLIIGPTLVLAVLVTAVTAAAVSVIRRLRPARQAAPGQRLRTPSRYGLLPRRLAMGVLGVVVVVITVSDLVAPVVDQAALAAESRTEPRQTELSARTKALQVYAWEKYGGLELQKRFITAGGELGALLQRPGMADESAVIKYCGELQEIAREAADYLPVPDTQAQSYWRAFTTGTAQGGRNCERALEASSGRMLAAALNELTEATTALSLMNERNESVKRAAGFS